jgi:hypothetical protein
MSVTLLLALAAFVCAIAAAIDKCPLWVAVILLCVLALIAGRV